MSKIDDAIRSALDEDDRAFLDRIEKEPSLLAQTLATFQGRLMAWNILGGLMTFALFGVTVFAVWKLVTAEDVKTLILYGTLASFSWLAVAMLKMWFWMQINTNAILREIKRLELRLARRLGSDSV